MSRTSVIELAAILLRVTRKYCSPFPEGAIHNNQGLRQVIIKEILTECRLAEPDATESEWSKAMFLAFPTE
jgi:hypothetical protein